MTSKASSERGAALITVLMIIAAMSVVAIGITQSVTHATQRARALDAQAQIRLYATSAEEVAKNQLYSVLAPLEGRLSADLPGYGEPQIVPVDGGTLTVTAQDATNCFDLNAIMIGEGGDTLQPDAAAIEEYQALLQSLEIDPIETATLVASLVDWLDANTVPGQGGAEDAYYIGLTPAYRTSSQPLSSLEELRAIRNYTANIIDLLRPLACTRPATTFAPVNQLNINTLRPNQAPLLRLALSNAVTIEQARQIIIDRPLGGWPDIETFVLEPSVAQVDPASRKTDRLTVSTTLVEVFADVSYRGQMIKMRYLFETLPGQPVRTLQRQRVG